MSADGRTVYAHLNYVASSDQRPQFHANDRSLDRVALDPRTVPIRDGRAEPERPTLAREGLQLLEWPTAVRDFRDAAEVARIYPGEITRFVHQLTGADAVAVTGVPIHRSQRAVRPRAARER